MSRRINLWWVLCAILCLPLLSMVFFPLADTSEPRYAEIARIMATTGDWITPWFEPGVPFWGKPPLSFWAEALSFKLFGVSEFTARLPSWLITLASLGLIISYVRAYFNEHIAKLSAIIYASCALIYMSSGAVLTDPFLAFGTTWAMVGLAMVMKKPTLFWRYSFFLGLAVGLLAKGPLAVVLVGGAVVPWLILYKPARAILKVLPWVRGSLLTIALALPWYIAAEIKTPGFIHYFIVGEHFLRFVDSTWQGDRYGNPHHRVHGTIWYYWIQASFPWGVLAIALLLRTLFMADRRPVMLAALRRPEIGFLVAWSLFTPIFFTMASNILWTYLLPALAPFSILLALALQKTIEDPAPLARKTLWLAAVMPVVALVVTLAVVARPNLLKTEKELVQHAQNMMQDHEPLVFVDKRPFSGRFYSHGTAGLVTLDQVPQTVAGASGVYLVVPKDLIDRVSKELPGPIQKKYEDRRYVLIYAPPRLHAAAAGDAVPARTPEQAKQ